MELRALSICLIHSSARAVLRAGGGVTALSFEVSQGVTSPQDVLKNHRMAKSTATIPGQQEQQFPPFSTHPRYPWRPVQSKNIHKL